MGLRPSLRLATLLVVDVDADHRMTVGSKGRRRDAADIAETENRDVHSLSSGRAVAR